IRWGDRTVGDILVFGVTPPYQVVQDYKIENGRGLTEIDLSQRRPVAVLGHEVAEKLFEQVSPIGQYVRFGLEQFEVIGVVASKGRVIGQSFDAFALIPLSRYEMLYGRRLTTTISVKMNDAVDVAPAMAKAEEAMRIAHRLRPRDESNFSLETAAALVDFW